MKKPVLLLIFVLFGSFLFGQELKNIDSALKRIDTLFIQIDSTALRIDKNVEMLKDEIVKDDPEPYTGQSIFEDRKGSSAIFLPGGGTFRLNTSDASLKFSLANRVSTKKLFYGFDISGKTNDGVLSLISEGNISPGAKINAIIGMQEFFSKSNLFDGWLVLKAGYEGSSFKLYNSDSAFASQVQNTSFNTFVTSLAFNLKIGGNKLLGLSAGYQKVNNYEDLQELEITDTKTITEPDSNTTRTYEKKIKARTGNYETSGQLPVDLDFFWTPNNNPRLGYYHYWRTKFTSGKITNGIGSGLYLLKKNNPLTSIAGIVFEISDISKLKDGYGKNFTVSFVVAYHFGFANKNLH